MKGWKGMGEGEEGRPMRTGEAGVSLVEMVVVLSLVSIVALIAAPEYGRFIAKGRVRQAASEWLQNMRLARTMAVRENRAYLITFDLDANLYRVGVDMDSDNDLITPGVDRYGTGPVLEIDLGDRYGETVIFGTLSIREPGDDLWASPASCNGHLVCFGNTANPIREEMNPDGSVENIGSVFIQHETRGFGYVVRVGDKAGRGDLWAWNGEKEKDGDVIQPPDFPHWTELR